MEPESPSPYPQVPATCLYPEPTPSSPHDPPPLPNFLKIILILSSHLDATLHSLFYLETALQVSGGTTTHHQERKQLYLQHLVFVIVTAICRYRGRDGTGLSVLWVAYATAVTV
jgi:hypothetical protein